MLAWRRQSGSKALNWEANTTGPDEEPSVTEALLEKPGAKKDY